MRFDRGQLRSARELLAELYPREVEQRRVARDAGLKEARVAFEPSAELSWFAVLSEAQRQDAVSDVLAVALREFPRNDALKALMAGAPCGTVRGPEMGESLVWRGPKGPDARAVLEQVMGEVSALVPVSYLARGLRCADAVVRVTRPDKQSGTGFVTGEDLLVTNHHVVPDAQTARGGSVRFNYQKTAEGNDAAFEEYALDPGGFFATSEIDDWTAVKITGAPCAKWGALTLKDVTVSAGQRVNIIQHPGGGDKQLTYFANAVVFVGDGRVQYLTDTLKGSSGAPVFDAEWNVVALHHSGGWITEPGSSDHRTYYRNEGISVDRLLNGLTAAGAPLKTGR